ncbi:DUF3488 and transglutaminase-like domain-containing protein [Nocardioides pacificus]
MIPARRVAARLIPGPMLALVLGLCAVALAGLAPSYSGAGFLLVGCAGLVLGAAVSTLVAARGWPPVTAVPLAIVVFGVLGGPLCLRSEGAAAWLPAPSTLALLADQLLFGWKDLLTTLPPVDGAGPLLVLPWVLGLAAGLLADGSVRLAGAARLPVAARVVLPLATPILLLALVVLLGVRHPHSLWLQGTVFAVLALTLVALSGRRPASSATLLIPGGGSRGPSRARLLGALAMLVLAGALAQPLGSVVAGGDDDRVILRTWVEPPFDVGRYPSPLAAFRRYVEMPEPDAVNLHDTTLLTVVGAPVGTRIRFAALDHYDGVVWGAADRAAGAEATGEAGTFQRVSSTIDNPVSGEPLDATVTLGEGWSGVWLPTAGALTSLRFAGEGGGDDRLDAQEESFRYNLSTSTAVVPAGLRAGDRYSFTASLPPDDVDPDSAPAVALGEAASAASFLETQAVQWSAGESAPMRRVFAVAEHLRREGKYSDGVLAAERIYHPGHHRRRLSEEFANAPIMVGNDEQYAAVMALLANRIGVPARVVLGAELPADGVVRGEDVQAWVELQVADGSWRTLPRDTFMDRDRPAEQPPQSEQEMSGSVVPPPAPIPPPSTAGEQSDAELTARKTRKDTDGGLGLPGWLRTLLVYAGLPLALVLAALGAVVLAKARRRRRRRTAARVSARVVGGWQELIDLAHDLGQPMPAGRCATRRQQAVSLHPGGAAVSAAPALARRADGHVFGRAEPEADDAAAFWADVEIERRSMSRAVGRWRRWRAAVNPASLRHGIADRRRRFRRA